MQLGNLVIIDYIRSSIDILVNLKFEETIQDQNNNKKNKAYSNQNEDSYINSSRGGHGNFNESNSVMES